MDNGNKIKDMDLGYGKEQMVIVILANGKMENRMVLEYINGLMVI